MNSSEIGDRLGLLRGATDCFYLFDVKHLFFKRVLFNSLDSCVSKYGRLEEITETLKAGELTIQEIIQTFPSESSTCSLRVQLAAVQAGNGELFYTYRHRHNSQNLKHFLFYSTQRRYDKEYRMNPWSILICKLKCKITSESVRFLVIAFYLIQTTCCAMHEGTK